MSTSRTLNTVFNLVLLTALFCILISFVAYPILRFVSVCNLNSVCFTDQSLKVNFKKHRKIFQTIVQMINSDKLTEVGADRVNGDSKKTDFLTGESVWGVNSSLDEVLKKNGLSRSRYEKYRSLLETAGVDYVYRKNSDHVMFSVWSRGIMTSSSYKQVLFSSKGMPEGFKPVESTDSISSFGNSNSKAFCSSIERNWFILYMNY